MLTACMHTNNCLHSLVAIYPKIIYIFLSEKNAVDSVVLENLVYRSGYTFLVNGLPCATGVHKSIG